MADFEYYIKVGMALRCNSEGLWYLSMGDQVFFLQEEESFWRVLVLLEKPYEEVREKLEGGFCYLNVVLAGLDSESDYWIGLALSWIEQGGVEVSDVLLARLEGVVEGRRASQKNRHKAFSVLRKTGG
ncbi:hypothetical protein [Pseudomonas aeruginosa]|uniref:hypothetical protein n=1 Tax=Pseudomonas aeruginosa TaxID=287 RepID=UPI002E2E442A|nr:hypothetical protein [Pseudomonas aeruginosa]HBN9509818.1 hypothetical protein [Pseudomonas aeruginosa]HBN9779333.1 hypothetical protein [Pseudomonas aeruginosa]HBN9850431.1 hypothetical protein [Pseudomonas aeruginosa]HBN9864077.1 hypothetical protein [Pseudomonas aeruginosa]HBN9895167.1 hypothetical protein [Pseudomonas aeruginosa]